MEGFLFIVFCLGIYFLPSIVAELRGRPNKGAIFVLNLFLGWTFLGWIIALVWAVSGEKAVSKSLEPEADTHHRCPECRELIRIDARKCRFCGTALAGASAPDVIGSRQPVAKDVITAPEPGPSPVVAKSWVEVAKEELQQEQRQRS